MKLHAPSLITRHCLLYLFCGVVLSVDSASAAGLNYYVAQNGNDAWSGQSAAPNRAKTDGPFATLEQARDVLRQDRAAGKLERGATVWIRGGTYLRTNTFELLANDGGTSRGPIVYRAYRREEVRMVGGVPLNGWEPITNAAILARLDPAATGHVLQADLGAQGISDWGRMTRRGFGIPSPKGNLELFFQDKPMTLARWPNHGWAQIAGTPDGQQGGKFTYEGDRPKRWAAADDIWVHGYWTYDWADSREKVRFIDVAKREIVTEPPHGTYGYKTGQRYFAENLLEELDAPGEWYLDRKTGILYFWPPAPIGSGRPMISILETPLVRLSGASFVTLRGFIFECSRNAGVVIDGGESNVVADSVLRDLGDYAVQVGGSAAHSGVIGCKIYNLDEGGINLDGGDRQTLQSGGNFAVNNEIHDYARECFTYRPAVLVNGVGNRVAHNRLHDAPHNAILFGGNDHLFEFNDVYRVCRETGDAGAFYTGRNLTTRGTIIRFNHFHDIARSLETKDGFVDVMSVYLDDCACGTTIFGNLFEHAGRAVMIGGGRDNVVENNIFIDCNPAIHVDARGEGWMKASFDDPKDTIQTTLRAVLYNQPPYSTRYPHLANILQDRPNFPKYNRIIRNICVGPKWIEWQNGLNEKVVEVQDNLTTGDPGFVDAARGNYALRPDSLARRVGFKSIPIKQIGLLSNAKD